jgi:hypothetical protein
LKPKGPNVDWEVDLRFGVRVIIEAKRRPTDLTRSIDSAELKRLSIFDALNKFREPHPPHSVNIGCVRLYGPIGIDVRLAAKSWLAENRHVSAVAFCAQNPDRNLAFAVVCRDGLAYVQELFSRPDREDERYVVLVQHTVEIPWLNLPKLR